MSIVRLFVILSMALLLASCASVVPVNQGLDLHSVETVELPEIGSKEAGKVESYTFIRVITNPAAAMAEPYPALIAYIWKPAKEPGRVVSARQRVIDALAELRAYSGDNLDDRAKLQEEHRQEGARYQEIFYDWLSGASPEDVLRAPNGEHYRAVGIDFKDADGDLIKVVKDGKIIASQEELRALRSWYGGDKAVVIAKPLSELIEEGWRIAIMTNDNSNAKHVYNLDGKGFNGEEWGTRYSEFNSQLHGVPFTDDRGHFVEVEVGTPTAVNLAILQKNLLLKAAIVAYKQDATEFATHLGLEEFKNFVLNPFQKRWIERKGSRLEALRQEVGRMEIGPVFVTNFQDAGVGFIITKGISCSMAFFGNRQVYYYGSAGSAVTRYDFAVANLEIKRGNRLSEFSRAKNQLARRHNSLVARIHRAERDRDEIKIQVLESQIADVFSKLERLEGH